MVALTLACCLLAVAVNAHEEKKEIVTKYKIFREDCFEAFFTRNDFFSDPTCLKFTFSKLVGFLIISGSFIYKVPQIIKILNAGSTKGINASSIYFESLTFLHTLAYSRHLQLEFSVYGETMIILAQQIVIIFLIYKLDQTVSLVEKILFVAFISAYATWLILDTSVPENAWPMISSSCIVFNILSRVP